MIISFIGPSGCGKGTQSKNLIDRDRFEAISGGAILREEFTNKTKIGIELYEKFWKDGKWVPDDIIFKLIIEKFNKTENRNIIFDAYPRTLIQAQLLDDYLLNISKRLDLVFIFDLSITESRKRIIVREQTEIRDDNSENAINLRFSSYYKNIDKIREYYKGRYVDINALDSIEHIYNFIKEKINESKKQ